MAGGFPDTYGEGFGYNQYMTDMSRFAQSENLLATAKEHQINAQKTQMQMLAEKKMAEYFQKQKQAAQSPQGQAQALSQQGDQLDAFANNLVGMANAAMGTPGGVAAGAKLAETAATIQEKKAQTNAAGARLVDSQLSSQLKAVNLLSGTINQMTDQSQLDELNRQWTRRSNGVPSPFMGMSLDQAKASSMTMKEQLDAKLKRAHESAYEDNVKGANQIRSLRDRLIKLQVKNMEAGKAASGKVQGTKISPASGPDKATAYRYLEKVVPNLLDEDKSLLADDIANMARKKMAQNRGLSYDEAVQQAYADINREHDLVRTNGILGFGKETTYMPGDVPARAKILTADSKPQDLIVGRFYKSPSGQVGMWTGQGFDTSVVKDFQPGGGDSTSPADENVEEESF